MADKLTQQITEALTRGAAQASGLPLYSSKTETGLFPNTSSAKAAAQKCLTDDLIRVTGTGVKSRELYGLTEKGWEFLLAAVNPKQVLEDFVRVLEERQGEVGELLDTARSMANSLQGLKEAVARVLPVVNVTKLPADFVLANCDRKVGGGRMNEETMRCETFDLAAAVRPEVAVALLDSPESDLASAIIARLADHSGPTDCTLPELFRTLALLNPAPSIGEFHDCLRTLHADGTLSLHSWTGPLYALPEPQYALMVGHGIAYYASLRG